MTTYTVPVAESQSIAAISSTPPAMTAALAQELFVRDVYHGGLGRIGPFTVKLDSDPVDLPLRRRLRLFRDRDGLFIREVWSDAATGQYQFDWIDERERYTALVSDHTHAFESLAAGNLAPTLIP